MNRNVLRHSTLRLAMPFAVLIYLLAGCAEKPATEYSDAAVRPVAVVADKPAVNKPVKAAQPKAPQPAKFAGVPVVPKSLDFVQKGLHNCGTVAMLMSWTKLHPRRAQGEWMSLNEFRQRFQLLVYAVGKGNANAVQS